MAAYQSRRTLHKHEARSTLDTLAREGAQRMLQAALEQEVVEFLGRARYARGGRRRGYRNVKGRPRRVAIGCGTVTIQTPRVRDTEEPLGSQILPPYQRSSEAIREILPELYLHGLATGDFDRRYVRGMYRVVQRTTYDTAYGPVCYPISRKLPRGSRPH